MKKVIKYIVNAILIVGILGIIICIVIEKNRDNNINESIYNSEIYNNNYNIIEQVTDNNSIKEKEYPKEEILDEYKGYKVCAKIEVPSISLNANILEDYSKKALKVSATKFWGVQPNKTGNFCVVGHNIKSMFSDIKKLEIGDTFFITDKKVGKVEYEIFNIYKVNPEDVKCLDSVYENQKEVTLITCTNDSKNRVIIKAKEKIN